MTKTRSQVWNHFNKVDKKASRCIHCLRCISVSGGSVGNLLRHIKRKHPSVQLMKAEKMTPVSLNAKKFINMVFLKKPLWDHKDWGFNQRDITDELWREIGEELEISRELAKSKWRVLKETYKKELRKTTLSEPTSNGQYYQSQWPYYQVLSFLEEQVSTEIITDNALSENMITEIVIDDNETFDNNDSSTHGYKIGQTFKVEPEMEESRINNQKWSDASAVLKEFLSPKGKRMHISTNKIETDDIDDDVSFFNSLLPHIRKLSPTDKFQLRNEINCVMLRYLYDDQSHSTVHHSAVEPVTEDTITNNHNIVEEQVITS